MRGALALRAGTGMTCGLACTLALLAAAAPACGQQLGPTWLWAQPLISPMSVLGSTSHAVTDLATDAQGSVYAVGKVYELCYAHTYAACGGEANDPSTSTDFGWQPGASNLSNAAFMTKVRPSRCAGRGRRWARGERAALAVACGGP